MVTWVLSIEWFTFEVKNVQKIVFKGHKHFMTNWFKMLCLEKANINRQIGLKWCVLRSQVTLTHECVTSTKFVPGMHKD